MAAPIPCPYCLTDKDPGAPVCPVCNRDTIAPASLLRERDELHRQRDAMVAELAMKRARLSAR